MPSFADPLDLIMSVFVFLLGLYIVVNTLLSAIRTFVLPRSAPDLIAKVVFLNTRRLFNTVVRRLATYEDRDRVMALLSLLATWLTSVCIGYTCMFRAIGLPGGWEDAFKASGSALFTLGFASVDGLAASLLSFSESAIGLILIALLISYLPTIYAAFSRRESLVTLLEVRAGSPPSAVEMFARFQRLDRLSLLHDLFESWEVWFADIDESHTSLAALPFFRSPQANRSWITSAGAVLDAASLAASTIDLPHDAQADLTIRAGYLALRHIADFFAIAHNIDPDPDDPISVSQEEFNLAYEEIQLTGIPVKADREKAWKDFKGWRVNYDHVLVELCALAMAPIARWSSDRRILSKDTKMWS